ncbi:MAG TPA: hypothetical protein PKK48_05400 [Phycisphaerae bacterium]|mgnify:CR=1 FL=1|nr:hypothetical protein [Phycisphaerae bacterium]
MKNLLLKHPLLLTLVVMAVFWAVGCYQVVHVQDMAGEPLKDARVMTKYSKDQGGGTGTSATTNMWGDAFLPISATGDVPAWLQISREGYMTYEMVYRTGDKITVELKPAQ